MQTNKYKIIAAAGIMLTTFGACKKFLNQQPISSVTTDNAYNTDETIEAALVGDYGSFMSTNFYQWEYIEETDMRSDNAYAGGSGDPDYLQMDLNNISNSNGAVQREWQELYASVAKSNIILDNIYSITDPALTEERRKQIIGEASFLRAFNYFQLVSLWSSIPLEKHSNSSDPAVIRLKQSTPQETYDFIVSDLDTALQYLPDNYGGDDPSVDKVRATKGAANALMAKVWAQRPDRDYNKVLTYCDAVINSPEGYQLMTNFADLFDGNHNYNSESILEIPFLANTPEASWGVEMFYPTHDDDDNVPDDAWQRYCVPSKTLVNAYDSENDVVRKNATISFEAVPWSDDNWNPCGDGNTKVPFNVKQKHPNNWSSGDHYYLLRLADIVLLKAEAQANTDDLAGAVTTLNSIRHRAKVVSFQTNASKEQLLTAILKERQLELAFEGQRWNDLNRYGVTVNVMNNLNEVKYTCNSGTPSAPVPIKYDMTQNTTVLPIPLTEIQANPNLVQNPGYTGNGN